MDLRRWGIKGYFNLVYVYTTEAHWDLLLIKDKIHSLMDEKKSFAVKNVPKKNKVEQFSVKPEITLNHSTSTR